MEDLQEPVRKYDHPIHLTYNFEESSSIYRRNPGLEFISGYLIEYSLSVVNIFVILMIFSARREEPRPEGRGN